MSQAVREALADAASTVAGIDCSPYFRQVTKPGAAVVRMDRINYPNKFGGVTTWQVVLILPQDVATAEKYLDSKVIPDVVSALGAEMVVTTVTPSELALDAGRVPCVVIEGFRESE